MKNLMIAILCGGLMSACHGQPTEDEESPTPAHGDDDAVPARFVQSCSSNDECKLVPPRCCRCGGPAAHIPVHVDQAEAYSDYRCEGVSVCPTGGQGCTPAANRIATCEEGECRALDLDSHEWMECSKVPADCMAVFCDEAKLCGIGGSRYDANMCLRPECDDDDDCAPGRICTEINYAPISYGYNPPGSENCVGGNLTMVRYASICLIQKDWKWTECSEVSPDCMQAACDKGLCGRGSSYYDENMCLRPVCIDDDDCAPDAKCSLTSVGELICGTDPDADVCECEVDYFNNTRRWVCLGPG